LPVVEAGRLVGIVTETDITRGLISLSPLQYVRDIMTRDVATIEASATADEAAGIMAHQNISCLVAVHKQDVVGICTEKDMLKRVVSQGKNPTQTCVAEIMSLPIVAVPPIYSILSASKKMESMHLHRLVIMDGKEVCGIVTQTDILRAIRTTFEAMESQQRTLARQLADLLRYVVQDMDSVQEFLDCIQGSASDGDSSAGVVDASVDGQTEQETSLAP